MTAWKGMGLRPNVRHRRDLILAMLREAEHPLTTQEIANAVDRGYYGTVYADLRTMCGSTTMPYAEQVGAVCAAGYPVIWHTWGTDGISRTLWSLSPEYRAEIDAHAAALEASWAAACPGSDA